MTSYTIDIEEDLEKRAFGVLKQHGITPAQAIKLFLTQIAETNSIPLDIDYEPNASTMRAMQDVLAGKVEKADSLEALIADVRSGKETTCLASYIAN